MRGRTLLLLLLLAAPGLLLVAPASAQSPSPSGVTITPATATVNVTSEDTRTVEVEVSHTGGLPAPFGQRNFAMDIQGEPEGWTASADPPSFSLAPGESQSVRITIGVATDAAASSAALTVVAQLLPVGVPGPAGPVADPEAQASMTIQASRDESLTREVLEGVGYWIYVILLALLALAVIVAKLVVDRRHRSVALHCEAPEQVLAPGGRAAFKILVENTSKHDETVVLHVSETPSGWAAFLPLAEMPLAADHVKDLQLIVIAPKDAPRGSRQPIQVTAAGSRRPGSPVTLKLEAVVGPASAAPPPPLPLPPEPAVRSAKEGRKAKA